MDDARQLQERWLQAARHHHAPSKASAQRMRHGLRARIAAGEPAPSWRPDSDPAPPPGHLRAWLVGGGLLLAAAAAIIWVSRGSTPTLARDGSSNAAAYGAEGRHESGATPGAEPTAPTPAHVIAAPAAATSQSLSLEASATAIESATTPPKPPRPNPPPRSTAEPTPRSATPDSRSATPDSRSATPPLDVAGEAALLRKAKAAIDGHAWAEASKHLDTYEARHASGVLEPEARALRVIVACARGAADASSQAQKFLARHPSSSLRDRIRRTCPIDPAQ